MAAEDARVGNASTTVSHLNRAALNRSLILGLDVLIVACTLGLLLMFVTGGVDLGFVSLREPAKPLLIVILAVAIRATLPGPFPYVELPRRVLSNSYARKAFASPALADVALAVVITRVPALFIGFVANMLYSPSRSQPMPVPFRWAKFAETFAAWDAGWYFDIATRGYYFNADGQSSIAFFPLYPMLIRMVTTPFGRTPEAVFVAGVFISCASFVVALIAIHRLTHELFASREVARRTVLYIAVFPFSLFFVRIYAESLFLMTSALAVRDAYKGRWWQAGVWGGLAAATRPNGMLIGIALGLLALAQRPSLRVLAWRCVALTPIPLAVGIYSAYVYRLSGDPLGWLSAQSAWGYSLGHRPWQLLVTLLNQLFKYGPYDYFFTSELAAFRLIHGAVGLLFLALTPLVFKRLGPALGFYGLVSLLIPLSGNALEGIGRYAAVLFPYFMAVGSLQSRRVHEAIVIVSSLFLALCEALFSTGRPIY